MTLSEGYYWFRAENEEWEVCRIISVRDALCAFFFFGRNTPIPIDDLMGEWVRIEPPQLTTDEVSVRSALPADVKPEK